MSTFVMVFLIATAQPAAQQFAIQTGPPVAAMPDPSVPGFKKPKDLAFVVRPTGCAEPSTFKVTATADSTSSGARKSEPVKVERLAQAGIFGLFSPGKGVWVVSVSATCGVQMAGALVTLTDGAYRRDGVELLTHHPVRADVERALGRPRGGKQP